MRRVAFSVVMVLAAILSSAGVALAQEFPARPLTLIIPWPAGGVNDVVLRVIAEQASKKLGQPILIDNKAGGGGATGPATMALSAKPDGYTFAQIPDAVYRLPLMQQSVWNAETDFTYIIGIYAYAYGLIVPSKSPFKTWGDVVAFAKEHPGKLTYSSPGAASSSHIGMEKLMQASGVKLTHVPFKGSLESNNAVAGSHVDLAVSGSSAKTLADAGLVKFIQMWTKTRAQSLPDVPTLQEDGFPFELDTPVGLAGPKGMSPATVAKIHDAFKFALETPESAGVLAKFDMSASYKSAADYSKFIVETIKSEREVLKGIGLARKD